MPFMIVVPHRIIVSGQLQPSPNAFPFESRLSGNSLNQRNGRGMQKMIVILSIRANRRLNLRHPLDYGCLWPHHYLEEMCGTVRIVISVDDVQG